MQTLCLGGVRVVIHQQGREAFEYEFKEGKKENIFAPQLS